MLHDVPLRSVPGRQMEALSSMGLRVCRPGHRLWGEPLICPGSQATTRLQVNTSRLKPSDSEPRIRRKTTGGMRPQQPYVSPSSPRYGSASPHLDRHASRPFNGLSLRPSLTALLSRRRSSRTGPAAFMPSPGQFLLTALATLM
jgi:hypothetical protein